MATISILPHAKRQDAKGDDGAGVVQSAEKKALHAICFMIAVR
jgi:hypothetical protein